jgi:hypothetical protein
VIAVIALVMTTNACDQSEYHKAADAAAKIATGLGVIEQLNESLYKSQLLDQDEAIAVATATIEATRANDMFVGRMQGLKQIDASNKILIAGWFGDVAKAVGALNDEGVLHVKNKDARAKLSIALSTVQASVQIIQAVLAVTPAEKHSASSAGTLTSARERNHERGTDRSRVAARADGLAVLHEAGGRLEGSGGNDGRTVAGIRRREERGSAQGRRVLCCATETSRVVGGRRVIASRDDVKCWATEGA